MIPPDTDSYVAAQFTGSPKLLVVTRNSDETNGVSRKNTSTPSTVTKDVTNGAASKSVTDAPKGAETVMVVRNDIDVV